MTAKSKKKLKILLVVLGLSLISSLIIFDLEYGKENSIESIESEGSNKPESVISAGEENQTNEPKSVIPVEKEIPTNPIENSSFPTLVQNSFTELFSGQGWGNNQNITVWHDSNTCTISFPPAYEWELSKTIDEKIIAAENNGKEILLLTSQGEILGFEKDEKLTGKELVFYGPIKDAIFNYDDSCQKWIVAAVMANDIYFYGIEKNGSKINSSYLFFLPEQKSDIPISLFCFNGDCLTSNGQKIWKFSILDESPKMPEEINLEQIFKKESIINLSIGRTNSSWILGIVQGTEKGFRGEIRSCNLSIDKCELLTSFSSKYYGNMYFSYDKEDQQVLALYNAYQGTAFKSSFPFVIVEDWSVFFPTRVIEGMKNGIYLSGIRPKIYYKGAAWWLGSLYQSPNPKFEKIENGVGIDFTPILLSNASNFQLVPGFGKNDFYGIVVNNNSKVYQFVNQGFEQEEKLVWESTRLNSKDYPIAKARFIHKDDGGNIHYFFSNNGGEDWTRVENDQTIDFEKEGNDFRWKAELYPSENSFHSPWISKATIEYYDVRE